jgi:hypothetical protein
MRRSVRETDGIPDEIDVCCERQPNLVGKLFEMINLHAADTTERR